ncbi:hypothetical protein LLG46_11835 [bacterium]|nr:hypothetical protein [bacterium]
MRRVALIDKDTSPEGYKHKCTYCGKPILEGEQILAVPEEGSVAMPFCSQECVDAYMSAVHEESDEEEDIFRAGAT